MKIVRHLIVFETNSINGRSQFEEYNNKLNELAEKNNVELKNIP